jgi:hypothetical protein
MRGEHLSDARLSEIGCDGAAVRRNGEAIHLESCAECAEKLEAEKRLCAMLSDLASTARIRSSFASQTRVRFEREMRARSIRGIVWISAGLFAVVAAWMILAWSAADAVVADAARDFAVVAALFRTVRTLADVAPISSTVGAAALFSSLLIAGGALYALVRSSSERVRLSEAHYKEV